MNVWMTIGFVLALNADAPATPATTQAQAIVPNAAAENPEPKKAPGINYESDVPPPTAFDRQEHGDSAPPTEGRSLAMQMVRTVLGLGVVLLLIFILSKIALPRLANTMALKGGKRVKILERTPLDGKHVMYILQLDNNEQLLIATGGQGVQLLSRINIEGAIPHTVSEIRHG